MAHFLFASTPVAAHSSNPLPIAARLVERGHRVDWYAGRAFHANIAAVGATPLPLVRAVDFSGRALGSSSGLRLISSAYSDLFIGQAAARVVDLRNILARKPADAMLCDGLMFGVDMVHELGGPPWATYGDTPLTFADIDTPPFGAGLLPMAGPWGRLRNCVVTTAVAHTVFARPRRVYRQTRAQLGLPRRSERAIACMMSHYLHLQACTRAFEYPRACLPQHVHWIGALHPDPPRAWTPPPWWGELAGPRPVVHVTQGSVRPDLRELILPVLRALADEDVLVVVTTAGPDAAAVTAALGGDMPANARVVPFIPYDTLLPHVGVFVTNGGYTGVTLALRHGVPIVQSGVTEEKAEVAGRIAWSGVGIRLPRRRPTPAALRAAVRSVLENPSYKRAAMRMRDEMSQHDASREAADRLEQLAATRLPVLRQ